MKKVSKEVSAYMGQIGEKGGTTTFKRHGLKLYRKNADKMNAVLRARRAQAKKIKN